MHVRKLLALWHQSEIDFVYPYALNPGAWIPRLQNVALDQVLGPLNLNPGAQVGYELEVIETEEVFLS